MEPSRRLTAVAVPMDLPNIDTDRVIPGALPPQAAARRASGRYFFHDVRFDAGRLRERPSSS